MGLWSNRQRRSVQTGEIESVAGSTPASPTILTEAMSNILSADDSTLEAVIDSKQRVLVKFGAEWCRPCKALAPILEDLSKDHNVVDVDIDEAPEMTKFYDVRGVPTLVLFEDGKEIARKVGSLNKVTVADMIRG